MNKECSLESMTLNIDKVRRCECISSHVLQYLDDTQHCKNGMHPFIGISTGGGGGVHVPFISTSMRGMGGVYDLNIESKM